MQASATLAYALLLQGKFDEGEPVWQEAIDLILERIGKTSPQYAGMSFIRAYAYVLHGHPDADEIVDDFIAFAIKTHGVNNQHFLNLSQRICEAYFEVGNYERGSALIANVMKQVRESPNSNDEDLLNVLKMESTLASLFIEASYEPEKALEMLNRIIPPLQEVWEPTYESMVRTEGLRASALSQKGLGDESVAIFAEIYNRLTDELGAENSTAQWLEVKRMNNLVSLQRWDEIDEIMRKRLARRIDNSELLLQMAEVIVKNGHEGYRKRYLNLALEATSRALAILGENDPEATYGHAMVYFAHGDYENALSWLAKTVAFAGEDHEDIEKYREKLDEVTAVINGEQEVSKELDL